MTKKIKTLAEHFEERFPNAGKVNFIEEEYCSSTIQPKFTFFENVKPAAITEGVDEATVVPSKRSGILGIAEGVFAVLDGESRNKRFYPEEFWRHQIEDPYIRARVEARDMQGTIGHHDKKVDNSDFASGLISHVITDLRIDEESRTVVGVFEILDTPAGHLLKNAYEADLPLYVSSRGAGKLNKGFHGQLDYVDKNNYFLECWDIVKDPGFLQAKPIYRKLDEEKLNSIEESDHDIDEQKLNFNDSEDIKNILEEKEVNMSNSIENMSASMTADEMVQTLLGIGEAVKSIKEELSIIKESKVKEVEPKAEEGKEEGTEDKIKIKGLTEQVQALIEEIKTMKAEVAEEVQEEQVQEEAEITNEDVAALVAKCEALAEENQALKEAMETEDTTLQEQLDSIKELVSSFMESYKAENATLTESLSAEKAVSEDMKKQLEEAVNELNALKLTNEAKVVEEVQEEKAEEVVEEAVEEVSVEDSEVVEEKKEDEKEEEKEEKKEEAVEEEKKEDEKEEEKEEDEQKKIEESLASALPAVSESKVEQKKYSWLKENRAKDSSKAINEGYENTPQVKKPSWLKENKVIFKK